MSDLASRLRGTRHDWRSDYEIMQQAADELDRLNAQALELCAEISGLRRENERLREELEIVRRQRDKCAARLDAGIDAALASITSNFAIRDFTGVSRSEVMHTLLAEHPKEDPFYCVDLRWVAVKYAEWAEHLPRVRPFMAVKCMPDKAIMTLLHRLGAGFDCASKVRQARVSARRSHPHPHGHSAAGLRTSRSIGRG